ncbi:MAG: hypothetical protein LUD15_11295 [Bacteroides sp.]|nr:hypothetical protein [Bacteroides sp.]
MTVTYQYDTYGRLLSELNENYTVTYTYDALERLHTQKDTHTDGKWIEKKYAYANGNISSIFYTLHSGFQTTEHYNYTNGWLVSVTVEGSPIWKRISEDSRGQITTVEDGVGIRNYKYNYGSFVNRITTNLQIDNPITNHTYNNPGKIQNHRRGNSKYQSVFYYDRYTQALYRYAALDTSGDDFDYDNAYRDMTYDKFGNPTSRTHIGTYKYNGTDKYRLTQLNIASETPALKNQQISYSAYRRPLQITEGNYKGEWIYNGSYNCTRFTLYNSNIRQLTRYYLAGQYEIDETSKGTKEKLYLGGDYYNASAVYVKENNKWTLYYI